jgi:hypothetical protein
MPKLSVYFSYSHRDEKWRDLLMVHLRPLERTGELAFWDDRQIETGDQWSQQIAHAIAQADIAILLVSAEFLASEFIVNNEVPRLLERQQEQGLVIVPVVIRPCAWQMVDWLARLQVLPRDGRPLSSLKNTDEALFEVARRIIEIGEIVSAQKSSKPRFSGKKAVTRQFAITTPPGGSLKRSRHVFVCHDSGDGDFAELLKLKLEKVGFETWIDVDRLRVGDDWRAEIDDAIRTSAAVVVVMTPEAKESEYVTYEWAYATGAGVKVVPLMVKTTQMHPRLESLQYLDFTNRRARPWDRLIEELSAQSSEAEPPQLRS